jgi:predicted dehydrogenase
VSGFEAVPDRVRIGIVGCGNIAQLNVPGYLSHERCDVVAVCDPLKEVATTAAEEWNVPRVYSELSDLLADDDIDAVEVLTPTHLHRDHVLAALAAGKHVSCQKPLANSVDECEEMTATARQAGLLLRVSECFAHYPPLERAKTLVRAGAIGTPTNIRIRTVVGQTDSAFQAGLRPEGYGWRMDRRSPGGHLFDDMVHKYAMALWLLDQPVVSVQAVVRRRDFYFEPCNVLFEYEDPGLLGSMEVSYAPGMWMRSTYYGADEFFEIQGDEGFIWVTRCTGEMLDLAPVMLYQGKDHASTMTGFSDLDADWGAGFRRSSAHFVDALLSGADAQMSSELATDVLRLCFAVYQAGNTRSPVDPRAITTSVSPDSWLVG